MDDTIELAYETFGDAADPPVILISGLGTQMLAWQEPFCEALAARGVFVVRFDNRDIGLSTHLSAAAAPDLAAAITGDTSSAAYTLSEMAADTAALLDTLGLASAHIVGVSMGGMIAQTLAIEHPERVRTLTSIMSTTGDRTVGAPTPGAAAVLLSPPATSRDEAIESALRTFRTIGSPGYATDESVLRELAARSYDRAFDPAGVSRQLMAIFASGDRTEALAGLTVPTLVIHGAADPLIDVSGGRATAAAIPGAELVVIDGMGHDLPPDLWPQFIDRIVALAERGDRVAT